MGCSPSIVYPYPTDRQPLVCSNVLLNGHVFIAGKEINDADLDISIPEMEVKLKNKENSDINFNSLNKSLSDNPQIFDPGRSISPPKPDKAEKKMVPLFNNKDQRTFLFYGNGIKNNCLQPINSESLTPVTPIQIQNTDAENLRSVLKQPNCSRKKVIRNRPLKTVTFLESVTVVSVR